MKKKTHETQPVTHRFSRSFLRGVTGVILASSLSFGTLGLAGCAPHAGAAPMSEDEVAVQQGETSDKTDKVTTDEKADQTSVDTVDTTNAADTNVESSADATFETVAADFDPAALDLEYSKRDTDPTYDLAPATTISLSGTDADVSGEGVSVADGVVTITAEGTYVVSGTFEGCVVVDAPDTDKVQLVLDSATITNTTGAAIFVKQADKCFITLAEGSENVLEDGANYSFEEGGDEPNAALFSKEDLTINGSGKLTVKGNYRHGVASKDDLVITGGELDVTSVEDGLRGKDCVKIKDGTFTITADQDGIKSNNDSDATRGFVSIDGGTFDITAGDEGVQAKTYLRIAGGEMIVHAADDALHSDLEGVIEDGTLVLTAGDDAFHAETVLTLNGGDVAIRECVEGYEAEKVYVNDGVHYIVSSDDAVNAAVADLSGEDSSAQSAGFDFGGDPADRGAQAAAGGFERGNKSGRKNMSSEIPSDSGAPSDSEAATDDQNAMPEPPAMPEGEMPTPPEFSEGEMPTPPEFSEGEMPERPEGDVAMESPTGERPADEAAMDPSANGAETTGRMPGGRGDFGTRGGFGGPGGMGGASEECLLQINGGYLWVDAQGDGLDSNGSLEINGGTVLVNGPSNSGNGGLDYELSATVDGGSVLVVGAAGMAADFTDASEQPFVTALVSGQAGDTVALVDSDGQILISMTATKSFQVVQASSERLVEGQEYTIVVGGSIEDTDEMGFTQSGSVEGGSSTTVTASTTPSGAAGGMGGRGGRF